MAFYHFAKYVVKPFVELACRPKYINKNNITCDSAVIIASNHVSNTDPMLLGLSQKKRIYFIAKAELFKNKILGALFLKLGAFPVNRGKGDQTAINHAEQILAGGHILGIFIEGTRSKTGDFLHPKNGCAMFAYDKQVPVVPVCITKLKYGRRSVHYGDPLTVKDLGLDKPDCGPKEIRNASRIIFDRIAALREEDRTKYGLKIAPYKQIKKPEPKKPAPEQNKTES